MPNPTPTPPSTSVETTTISPAPTSDRWVVRGVLGVLAAVVIGSQVALGVTLALSGDIDLKRLALAAIIHLGDIGLGGVIGFLVSAKSQA